MHKRLIFLALVMFGSAPLVVAAQDCASLLDFSFRPLGGSEPVRLCEQYQGKVLLIVNTASKCGYTPQYGGLEKMYKQYQSRGLVVVGFPSNDFGGQEPGSEQQIVNFCRLTYGVEFPMFEKTHAARERAHPLYQALGEEAGQYPQWNFHKYLIDREGNLAESFPSAVEPYDPRLIQRIEQLL